MSKEVKVTGFSITGNMGLIVGQEVVLAFDPNDEAVKHDDKAIVIIEPHGRGRVGVIGKKEGSVNEDCINNVELYDTLEPLVKKDTDGGFSIKATVFEETTVIFSNGKEHPAVNLTVEIPVPEKKTSNMKEFVLNVRGSVREFKGKTEVLKEIQSGNKFPLQLKKNSDGKLITFFKDGEDEILSGSISKAITGELEQLENYTEKLEGNGQYPTVEAFEASGNSYKIQAEFDPKDFEAILAGKSIKTLAEIKEEKLREGIADQSTFDQIEAYLKDNKVGEGLIKEVFESMILYPEKVRHRIRKPETLYVNMGENMVRKAIVYMNKGKHLNFIGDKGIGKNVLIETLSWVYQRPLYSAGYHSQIDKMDILGGKTFETDVEDGKSVTKMVFEKELLVEAMEVGGIMNPDEINAADPSVLFIYHPVTDDRRELEVPGLGLIKAHEKFNVITTMNEDYVGTNELNEAFKRRFTHFRFPAAESIADLLTSTRPDANPSDIRLCDKVYGAILNLVKSGQLTNDCISVSNYREALDVVDDLGLEEALVDNIANQIGDESYRNTIVTIIDDMVG